MPASFAPFFGSRPRPLARRPILADNIGMRLLRLTLKGSLAAGLLLPTSGCASMGSTPSPTLPVDPRPEPVYVTDGPGCAEARARARRTPNSKDIYPPLSRSQFVPVASASPLNGATLLMTVRVDTAGRAVPSTARVVRHDNGVLIPGYRDDITSALERLTFRPAVLGGCAVEGTATLLYNTRR